MSINLPPPYFLARRIVVATSTAFNVTPDDLLSEKRLHQLVMARQMAMVVFKTKTKRTISHIGQYLNRDHTTVLHGLSRMSHLIERDETFRETYNNICEIVDGRADHTEAALPAVCERVVQQQQEFGGQGPFPDLGVQAVADNGGLDVELTASSATGWPLSD
jgi:hypothetical protein